MKLTKETLKRIVKEELNAVLREVRIDNRDLADLGIPQVNIGKIHDMIERGETEQAQVLIDSFADMMGETGYEYYARNYFPSREVGDLEKLGNQAANAPSFYDTMVLASDAKKLANKKADEMFDDLKMDDPVSSDNSIPKSQIKKTHMDRFYSSHEATAADRRRKKK